MRWLGFLICLIGFTLKEQDLPGITKTGNLAFVVVAVNGQHQQVAAGETLRVVWGDRLKVLFAQLENGKRDVELINVVGYRARKDSADDRQVEFRSDRDLNPDWAHNQQNQIYRINISSKRHFHGRIYIQVEEPRLDHVMVKVNGTSVQVKSEQKLPLRTIDQFKVEKVVANLDAKDPSFRYLIETTAESTAQDTTHEIRFYRYERLFAKIPLVVAD